MIRKTLDINGVVQGVGFRPAVHNLAIDAGLTGSIQNRAGTVRLVLEGVAARIEEFVAALPDRLPPNASIRDIRCLDCRRIDKAERSATFTIVSSEGGERVDVVIPADLAMCPDCRCEIRDPDNRRYGYAFTTCTQCGPRYTVVNAMPYDRERTTMHRFPLCPECREEYENTRDRRFHAESTACPVCGPRLTLLDAAGVEIPGDPLRSARRLLADGSILAVRGIGGFLLAVDANHRDALARLRERKMRPDKPFAVMARDPDVVEKLCALPAQARELLESPVAPIIILDILAEALAARRVPFDLLTPDATTLGVMLPTTPLHDLLAAPLPGDPVTAFDLLVMTSGNKRSEPICIANEDALSRLAGIADAFLVHDREINLRNDDSLFVLRQESVQVWRRARGCAPNAITLARPLKRPVLGMGAELKNTIALGFDSTVVISPHVGDLETPEAVSGLETVADCFPAFLQRTPAAVAVDLNPDMHSSILGRKLAAQWQVPVVKVQHHHAHAAACLAEHGREEGLCLSFDGTGLGPDGTIWGAELLAVTPGKAARLATFAPALLPGGDAAVQHPVRQLVGRFAEMPVALRDKLGKWYDVTCEQWKTWHAQCRQELNAPCSSGAGRVFDAFAVLLGVAPREITYEGQPAIRLESLAHHAAGQDPIKLPFKVTQEGGILQVDWQPVFEMVAEEQNGPLALWALSLHHAIANAALEMIEYGVLQTNYRSVALSGGVFMNRILNDILVPALREKGLEPLLHRRTPPNDGCIAFGQAVVAGMMNEI